MKSLMSFCVFGLALAASAARPVARWDVVPWQRVDGVFRAGVCAFHEDGVQVRFTVNGTPAGTAKAPSLNPRTRVWEYVLEFDTSKYPDGEVTLGARAVSAGAEPESFDLPALTLFANGKGTLSVKEVVWADAGNGDDAAAGTEEAPLKTLKAAMRKVAPGGTVRLKAGLYNAGGIGTGKDGPYWTTVEAAPGLAPEAVEIGPGPMRPGGMRRLKFRGVTLFCDQKGGYVPILVGEQGAAAVWTDRCRMLNKAGRWAANSNAFGNGYVAFVTGGVTTEMMNGPGGSLVRDHRIETLASDVWTGSDRLVVNCSCRDVDGGDTGSHPDFHQSYCREPDWVHDVILYNVSGRACKCQGLFGSRLRDSAFVNVLFERQPNNYFVSQYSGPMENVLFAHVTLAGQVFLWRKDFKPKDVRVVNCLMPSMSSYDGFSGDGTGGLLATHNHFSDGKRAFGLDSTKGDPLFKNPEAYDYSPAPGSPAASTGMPLACVPADLAGTPYPAGARPAGALAVGAPK